MAPCVWEDTRGGGRDGFFPSITGVFEGSFFLLISRICRKLSHYSLHPGKLTWNLKMDPSKRRFLLETIIFRFHVSFRGGTPILCWFVESVVVKPEHGKLNNHGSRPFFWNDLTGQMSNEKRAPGLFGFIFWWWTTNQVCGDYNKLIHYKDPYQPTAIMESRRFSFPSSSELGCWFFRDDFVHRAFFQRRKHPSLHRPVHGGCIFCKKKLRIFGGDHHDHPIWRLFYLATFLFFFSCPCSFRLQNMMRIRLSNPRTDQLVNSMTNNWCFWLVEQGGLFLHSCSGYLRNASFHERLHNVASSPRLIRWPWHLGDGCTPELLGYDIWDCGV